jgi:hypothetical protein
MTRTVANRRIPKLLRGRLSCDEDDFVGRYFPSGESRDAARRLWRLLENDVGINLSGLHPDDDLPSILADGPKNSLDVTELVIALENELGLVARGVETEDSVPSANAFKNWRDRTRGSGCDRHVWRKVPARRLSNRQHR